MDIMSGETTSLVTAVLDIMATLFVFMVGIGVLAVIVIYILGITPTTHAIRRNYPVVGRFRYFSEHMGEFFRQYVFAMDREELPFNRARRSWVYRTSKGIDTTVGFGSTRDLRPTGITTHNRRLQKGPDPKQKSVRVANYAKNMVYAVGIIAHSCGVKEPRQLQRFHARVVGDNGLSIPLNELHADIPHPPGTSAPGAA